MITNVNIGKRVLINLRSSKFHGQHGIIKGGGPYLYQVEIGGCLWAFNACDLLLDELIE